MPVDTELLRRESAGNPIRVALIGAGATGRAIALQLGSPVPGIRLSGIANRTAAHAERAFRDAGIARWTTARSAAAVDAAVMRGIPVLVDDPALLVRCPAIDVVIEVTGTIDFAAGVVLEAIAHGKHVVIVNAELDSTLGPILKARADAAGVVLGARVPIILTSRADNVRTRLASCAVAMLLRQSQIAKQPIQA
jgi:predicted homoserine dehydrogenase-like protein